MIWEEIHGFQTPGEYQRFVEYIARQTAAGLARELTVDPRYGRGEVYGGLWFQDLESGEVWRLVPPDPPFTGLWERVRNGDA